MQLDLYINNFKEDLNKMVNDSGLPISVVTLVLTELMLNLKSQEAQTVAIEMQLAQRAKEEEANKEAQ